MHKKVSMACGYLAWTGCWYTESQKLFFTGTKEKCGFLQIDYKGGLISLDTNEADLVTMTEGIQTEPTPLDEESVKVGRLLMSLQGSLDRKSKQDEKVEKAQKEVEQQSKPIPKKETRDSGIPVSTGYKKLELGVSYNHTLEAAKKLSQETKVSGSSVNHLSLDNAVRAEYQYKRVGKKRVAVAPEKGSSYVVTVTEKGVTTELQKEVKGKNPTLPRETPALPPMEEEKDKKAQIDKDEALAKSMQEEEITRGPPLTTASMAPVVTSTTDPSSSSSSTGFVKTEPVTQGTGSEIVVTGMKAGPVDITTKRVKKQVVSKTLPRIPPGAETGTM